MLIYILSKHSTTAILNILYISCWPFLLMSWFGVLLLIVKAARVYLGCYGIFERRVMLISTFSSCCWPKLGGVGWGDVSTLPTINYNFSATVIFINIINKFRYYLNNRPIIHCCYRHCCILCFVTYYYIVLIQVTYNLVSLRSLISSNWTVIFAFSYCSAWGDYC